MEPPSVPLRRAVLSGILAAIGGSLVLWTVVLLVSSWADAMWAIPGAGLITWRVLLFLFVFGGLTGAIFLRHRPLHWGRIVLVGVLATICAPVPRVFWDTYQYRLWQTRVLEPDFEPGTTQQELVKRLGRPTNVVHAPVRNRDGSLAHCSGLPVARRLEYTPAGGGTGRVFNLDAQGRLLCESRSFIHVWW